MENKLNTEKLSILLTAYQVLRNNIEFYKRQQWQVSYYGIAINGALSFIYLKNLNLYPGLKAPILILGIVATIICLIIVSKLESSICKEKKSIDKILETVPILKAITFASYTTMNLKKSIQYDSSIFETVKEPCCKDTHSYLVFGLAIVTTIIGFLYLIWIINLQATP